MIVCPFRATTGLACPGCGGTRAVLHLVRGRPLAAARHNAAVTLCVPAALVAIVAGARPAPRQRTNTAWLLLAFGVVRNLPPFRRLLSAAATA